MEYAICTVPVAPVRKEASHRSEMVNQLLFGETMEVLEEKGEWFRIRSCYDQYDGWLTWHLIMRIEEKFAIDDPNYLTAGLINPVMFSGSVIHSPMGSSLVAFDKETGALWDDRFQFKGEYKNTRTPFEPALLLETARKWTNAPYLWGGKTFMGVDCSGFAQTIFKLFGIKLKRDAWQQAEEGLAVADLSSVTQGDLAFFKNEKGHVIHVGILINGNEIIHASGKVRVDDIDEAGIINRENGRRTHQLHSIRRYF